MRVHDFMHRFNKHRRLFFSPSDRICVDESISHWYGHGGFWINHGLPHYVTINRKPENGAEIQNAACGRSGTKLSLKLVTSIEYENGMRLLPPGTETVKEWCFRGSTAIELFARTVILRLSPQPRRCSDLLSNSLASLRLRRDGIP
jgi:hypothetical protein